MMTLDLRYLVGTVFAGFAYALLSVNLPIWALFPGVASIYILGSSLWDELKKLR